MNMKKILSFALCLVLVAGLSIGGTLAWITAKTTTVKNTFTVGNINLTLQEHDYVPETNTLATTAATVVENKDYKIVPGMDLPKDPFVTVKADSEACWLFVKVEKSDNWLEGMTYEMDKTVGWTELSANSGIYWIKVDATTKDTDFNILEGKTVDVSENITKDILNDLKSNPTLSFTAYAVQQNGLTTADAAWTQAQTASIY